MNFLFQTRSCRSCFLYNVIILWKTCNDFMQDLWNGQFVQFVLCYTYLWTYLTMFDKKRNKRWKRNIVTREVTELYDEFILINRISRHLYTNNNCALFCRIHRKVAQLVPWLLLKNRDISSLQHPNWLK